MSSGKPPAGFPDAEAKLAKPIKQSAFERSKAEAEAKRKRDEAETAAVLKDFVKSFDNDEDDYGPRGDAFSSHRHHGSFGGPPSGNNTGKRHFAMSNMRKSGPGSLGPVPNSYGSKKSLRSSYDFPKGPRARANDFPSGPRASTGGPNSGLSLLRDGSDDEDALQRENLDRAEMKAIAKPQLRLSNLPPRMSAAAIRALIPSTLVVDAVKIEQPAGSSGDKRCTNAVVTLCRDSLGGTMDAAVSSLQNKYLGYGHYLSAQRHLSSAVLNPVSAPIPSSSAAQPFGAKPLEPKPGPAKQMGQHGHRGYAPPTSYGNVGTSAPFTDRFHVPVKVPADIHVVRMIHKLVEAVREGGPRLEALVMSRATVQQREKWAWLWDSKSAGGIWYRWRLWELLTGRRYNYKKEPFTHIFDNNAPWQVPEPLPYEFVCSLDEFVSQSEYESSEDEELDHDGKLGEVEKPFLNPLHKAKLVHLLARLPTNHSKLRRGDVARVTAFALEHADRGPAEVVDLIVTNILRPFAFTSANPNKRRKDDKEAENAASTADDPSFHETPDSSGSSLVGLFLVSDLLSSASTTTFRHSWRFRGLFEEALKNKEVFEFLGLMPEQRGWGRLRAKKWKRSINVVLNLWEGWCVFPGKAQEAFSAIFDKPPSTKVEEEQPTSEAPDKSKWKSLTAKSATTDEVKTAEEGKQAERGDVVTEAGAKSVDKDGGVQGVPIADDDVEGLPITEDDVDDEAMMDDGVDDEEDGKGKRTADTEMRLDGDVSVQPMDDGSRGEEETKGANGAVKRQAEDGSAGQGQRKRIRAVDMFADSNESDGA